jgi:ABC-type uncharacterized transport system YnjBCD ATPase subunit
MDYSKEANSMIEGELKNVALDVEGNTLTITIDLSKELGPSASGKSTLIASTGGAVTVEGGARVNLSVYRKTK